MVELVGIAQAKNDLSELVNRAAYGGERIVLASHGKPKAAIVSLADLQRLAASDSEQRPPARLLPFVNMPGAGKQRDAHAVLADAAALREQMAQERGGKPLPDSTDAIPR